MVTTKATPARLKKPEEMNAEEAQKYNAMSSSQQTVYKARLAAQDAADALAKAKEDEARARDEAHRSRIFTAAEKKLASGLRNGEFQDAELEAKIQTIVVTGVGAVAFDVKPPTSVREELKPTPEEVTAIAARVRELAKKAAPAATVKTIPTPTFKLGYELLGLRKTDFAPPQDGARPDSTLTALVHRYGHVLPFAVLPKDKDGLYPIFDGKRRYHLLTDDEVVPAVIISGFPDEYTQEGAEIAVNRARSLNVFRAGEVIARSRVRGKSDTQIRSDMGFKTGEVNKYAAAVTLPPVILQGIKDGRVTANTALAIAKQPAHIVARLAQEFAERRAKEDAKSPARITEADVDALRAANSRDAVKRDAGVLSSLTGSATQSDAGASSVNP